MQEHTYNIDPHKLLRDGTNQELRFLAALDPEHAPINEKSPEDGIVFAQAYAQCLKFFETNNPKTSSGDWAPFFSNDVAAQLAITAVQNVPFYRQKVRESLNFLNTRQNATETEKLRTHLDSLFSGIATLTLGFDQLIKKLFKTHIDFLNDENIKVVKAV